MQRYNRTAGKHHAPVLYNEWKGYGNGWISSLQISFLPRSHSGPLKFDAADGMESCESLFEPL